MGLDIRTMMVMTALLTLLLSGLLALASLHADSFRGIRYWALAELCIGLGLGLAITQLAPPGNVWVIVLGAFLVAVGMNFQLIGIQTFRGWRLDWRLMGASVTAVLFSSIWFTVLHHDADARAIVNSLVLALVNAVCARALLVRVEPQQRTAYWFTGAAFALVALFSIVRAGYLALSPEGSYGLYAQIPINPITFFVGSVLQLVLTFGFLLMMHYRIAAELQRLAARDSLTGALNRRSLEEEFNHLCALYSRTGGTLSVMMLDIDRFKAVNDRYGHLTGDDVLCRLARLAEATIRRQDYFARYGGEEFCILLPATVEGEAAQIAERLRQAYAEMPMDSDAGPWFGTISIGVADSAHTGLEFSALVAAADQALYRAKQDGRNRVVAYSALA